MVVTVNWPFARASAVDPVVPCWLPEVAASAPVAPVTKNLRPPPEPPVYFAEMVRSFARETLSEPFEEPAPAPDLYRRQSSAFVSVPTVSSPWGPAIEPPVAPREEEPFSDPAPYNNQRSLPPAELPVFVPVPCVPAFEPPVYCDKSTGPFGSEELLLVPEGDEPVADPVPPNARPSGGDRLLVPAVEELVPDPEPLKRAGPYGVDPLVLPAEGAPLPEPVPLNITGLFGGKLLLPPDVEEPVPDPVPLKRIGPNGAELLLVPAVDDPVPGPVPLRSTGPLGAEPLLLPEVVAPLPDPVPPKSTGLVG